MKSSLLLVLTSAALSCLGETNSLPSAFLVTAAYRDGVLKVMLAEVNEYARRLNLPEHFPVTTQSLALAHVSPPGLAERFGGLGNLHTTNYAYAFGKGRHLTYITRLPKDKSNRPLFERFQPWQIDPSMVNTNAAYALATQVLATAFVDLPELSRSTTVSIRPITILHMTTSVYDVEWRRGERKIAEVGVDEPTKELWLLRIEDPEIILRKPLETPNP